MVYFDLDGVIRSLHSKIGIKERESWNELMPNGDTLCEYIDKHKDILLSSEHTEYFDVIKKYSPITILSHQPIGWRVNTMRWIDYRLPDANIIFVGKADDKLRFMSFGDTLVEDSPNFESWVYPQVLLIDWKYNRHITNAKARITKPEQLKEYLEAHYGRYN
jgi:hypothetical protein